MKKNRHHIPMLRIIFVLILLGLFSISFSKAATYYSRATGNWDGAVWSTTTNGTATTATILSTDDVVIQNGNVITVNTTANCASLTINTGGANTGVSISGTNSLSVANAITLNAPSANNRTRYIVVGTGTLTAGSISMATTTADSRDCYISVSTGTINVSGNVTMNGTAARNQIVFLGAGTLNIGGTGTITGGTISNATGGYTALTRGTVDYNGSTQTIGNYTYYNLATTNAGVKSLSANTTILNNLTINTGSTLDLSTFTANRSANGGTLTVAGTLVLGSNAGGQTGSNFPTNFTTMTMTGGTVEYNRAGDQTVYAGSGYNNLTISGSNTKTLSANTTVSGTLTVNAGSTLALSTYNLSSPTNTVLYGGATTASSITGTGTLTLGGNVTVNDATTGTNAATISCPIALGATRTFTVADDGTAANDLTISGIISGGFGLSKEGAGTLLLSGTNTYSGGTTLTEGTLTLGSATSLSDAGLVRLNGGTLNTGGYGETMGELLMDASSSIYMGSGSHTITFGNSSAYTWTGTLTIDNWGNGSNGKIQIGAGGLNSTQLAQINFTGYPSGADITSTGELVPKGNHFRSVNTGNWDLTTTWESSPDSVTWSNATYVPGYFDKSVVVQSPHVVTIAASLTVDKLTVKTGGQLTVNSGQTLTVSDDNGIDMVVDGTVVNSGTITPNGTIAFNSGSTYQHNQNGGTLPTATWHATSNCNITGITTTVPTVASFAQSFGNFTWNCTGQTANLSLNGNLTDINGNLTISSTNTGSLRLSDNATTATLDIAGNFSQTGGTFYVAGTGGACTMTVTLQGNFSLSGGTFNMNGSTGTEVLNVAGSFSHTAGTITETSTGTSTINFNGNTVQTYTSGGTISNTINFAVQIGATLDLGTEVINGGNGTFTVNNGANIITAHTDGLSTTAGTGSIRVTGTKTYNTGANYTYNGSSAQNTGNGFTGANNLTINNTAGVTLTSNATVSGSVYLTNGKLTTNTNALTVTNNSASAIVGASTTKFINGRLAWTLAPGTLYTFPVGKNSTYLPFGLSSITGSAPQIRVEAFDASSGGSAGGSLTSISTSEYWQATLVSGTYSNGSISLTRQTALGTLNSMGRSATQTGVYASINGVASGTSVVGSDISGNLGFFLMGVQNFVTNAISPLYYCAGSNVTVSFTSSTRNAGNVFTAELSDASGSFTSPTAIGTLSSTTSGTINATIPGGQADGSGYRIRVTSSDPNATSSNNGEDISIGTPTIISTSPGSRCQNGQLTVSAIASAGTINWYENATGGSSIATGNTYQPTLTSTTTYYVDATAGGSCTSTPRTAVSAYIIEPPTITTDGGGYFCTGDAVNLISTISGTNTNQFWTGPNSFYSTLEDPPLTTSVTSAMAGTYTITSNALSGINLVINGDFESRNVGFGSAYTFRDSNYVSGCYANAPLGCEGTYSVVANPRNTHPNFSTWPDHSTSGAFQMVINGATTANVNVWSQTVNVVPNTYYQFTYWIQTVEASNPSKLQLYVNGVAAGPVYTASSTINNWTQFLYNWSSESSTSAYLSLVNQNTIAGGNDFALDDIVFQHTCSSSATVDVYVNAVPTAGAIGSDQTICSGVIPATITSTTNGTGSGTITYQWESSPNGTAWSTISGATSATYSPPSLTATTYYRRRTVATNGGTACYSGYTGNVIKTVTGGATASAGGPNSVCISATPSAITLTGATFGGGPTTAAWSIVSGGGTLSSTALTATPETVTYTPAANFSGTVTLRLTTDVSAGCSAVSDRLIFVDPITAITGQSTGTQTQCQGGTFSPISVTAVGGGLGYQWYSNTSASTSGGSLLSGATSASYTPSAAASGTLYYYCIVNGNCGSDATSAISGAFIVNPATAGGTIASAQTICSGTSPADLTLSGHTGTVVKWQKASDAGFTSPTDIANTSATLTSATIGNLTANTYFRAVVQSGSCTSVNSGSVLITVAANPTLTGASQQATVCAGASATINLTGLTASTTSTVNYSINGVAQTPVTGVVANGSGAASFATAVLTGANNGQVLQVTGITRTSTSPNCSASFTQNVTLSVDAPLVTVSLSSSNNECPELQATQGFQPDNTSYDPGATEVIFDLVLSGTTASDWTLNYNVSGTNVVVREAPLSYPSPNPSSATGVSVTGSTTTQLIFYINNSPGNAITPMLNVTSVTAGGCTNNTTSSGSVNIKAMPEVGSFN